MICNTPLCVQIYELIMTAHIYVLSQLLLFTYTIHIQYIQYLLPISLSSVLEILMPPYSILRHIDIPTPYFDIATYRPIVTPTSTHRHTTPHIIQRHTAILLPRSDISTRGKRRLEVRFDIATYRPIDKR